MVGVGSKNNKGVLIGGPFVRLQRLKKGIEGRILTVSVSIDPGRLGIRLPVSTCAVCTLKTVSTPKGILK
jgi:hypothetical protein